MTRAVVTPRWEIAAELADTLELRFVQARARDRRDHADRTSLVEHAYTAEFPVMARLLAAIPAESTIDREAHAARVALTVADFKRRPARVGLGNHEAGRPILMVGAGRPAGGV